VARRHGLAGSSNLDAVLAEYADGRSQDVVGSPHFFIDRTSMFCPVLDIRRVDGNLRVKVDQAALDTLVATCFG